MTGICGALVACAPLSAQAWGMDVYAGGTRPQGVEAQVRSTGLVGNLRWQGASGFGYGSVGAPLDDAGALWSAAGAGGRWTRALAPRWAYGAELGADGYGYHDRGTQTDGGGLALRAIALLSRALPSSRGSRSIELRAGPSAHWFGGLSRGSRTMGAVGARFNEGFSGGLGVVDVRAVATDSTRALWGGVQVSRTFSRGRAWGSVGRWSGDLEDTGWEIGGALAAGPLGELWASVRQDATDPLYASQQRRSWNVGISRALGRAPAATLPPPTVRAGRVRIRLPRQSAPAAEGTIAVAGEFNRWTRVPLARSGGDWVLDLPLGSGVYRFAFVSPSGEWFVPDGYPGRIDDDMGGHVAVLVVP
jgi:hypothetical protein